jgi:hypothetical protein
MTIVAASLGRLVTQSSSPRMARVAHARSLAGFGKITGFRANHTATSAASLRRRVQTGTSTNGALAQRVHALHGLECRANIACRARVTCFERLTAAGYLAAVCSNDLPTAGPGNGVGGTSGVPIWPASHGRAAAKACDANGQSCLPG